MLTPKGIGARRRRRRTAGIRFAEVVLVLAVLGAAGYGLWRVAFASSPASDRGSSSTTPSASPSACATTVAAIKPPAPATVRVNVYNATTRSGLAAQVAGFLRNRGFAVATVANDPLKRAVAGPAEIRSAPGSPAALTLSLHALGSTRVADTRRDGSVDLVLGLRFTTLRTPAQVAAAVAALATPRPAC